MKRIAIWLLVILFLMTGCKAPEAAVTATEQPQAEAPAAVVPEPEAEPEPEPEAEPVPEEPAEDRFVFTRENLPVLDGSTSMVPLGQAVAAALLGESQSAVEDLTDFHRTTESFRYLMRGESDLLLVAEPNPQVFEAMQWQNFSCEMEPIAKEALVFIVNSENPIESLTVEQLQKIYTGEITNWSQVGGNNVEIAPFQRNATSGSQVLMDKLVMGDLEMMEAPQEWIPGEMSSLMAGVRGYEDSAAAIGYSVYYYAEDMRMAEGMKIIAVNGVEPTDETIAADEYPLINPYFAVIDKAAEAGSTTRILFDWLRSADGQAVLESQGYVPVGASVTMEQAVYMDTSGLEGLDQPAEKYTRLSEEWIEDLVPGDYGLLRPYVGSRAAFDVTIYGGQAVYDGAMGLIDENGIIVVDPVYTEVTRVYNYSDGSAAAFYQLAKPLWVEEDWGSYMGQIYGACSLDGSVVLPCRYEWVSCCGGMLMAVESTEQGLFQIYAADGTLLLDSRNWPARPALSLSEGMGTILFTEKLIFLSVRTGSDGWDTDWHLYNWQGNLISDAYDWVDFGEEAPYLFQCYDNTTGYGYLDAEGREILTNAYEDVSPFRNGRAIVKLDGVYYAMDSQGNLLHAFSEGYVSTYTWNGYCYYICRKTPSSEREIYYDWDFQPVRPDVDKLELIVGNVFRYWEGNTCYLTDGTKTVVLEGTENSYIGYSWEAAGDRILIISYDATKRGYWLLDRSLELQQHGTLLNQAPMLLKDSITGETVPVYYDMAVYPYDYRILDAEMPQSLQNVKIKGLVGGWYQVEDDFTAGYMDAEGNWLFRVNLMTDMVD